MYAVLKRRLSDKIEDVLEEACMIGDLQTAEELLQVLDLMQARRPPAPSGERRAATGRLDALRGEVARLQQIRAARVARRAGRSGG